VNISVNSIEDYIRDLTRLISTPYPEYAKLGGPQLSHNVLQIENEYYSFIRPKRVARSGERPTKALRRAGVEYVEVRALDVSAFDPVGVNQNKLRFLEAFLALCILKDSPPVQRDEQLALDANHVTVAHRGREPGLMLQRDGRPYPMKQWAESLLDEMQAVCELLDANDPARPYAAALTMQATKIRYVALTPSARILKEMQDNGECFFDLALRMSAGHKAYFLDLYPPNEERLAEFHAQAEESLRAQRAIEAGDDVPLEEYIRRYLA
jgi:glutamate--cysteine ligase